MFHSRGVQLGTEKLNGSFSELGASIKVASDHFFDRSKKRGLPLLHRFSQSINRYLRITTSVYSRGQ